MSAIEPKPFAWNYCPICGQAIQPAFDGESARPHCAPCGRFYYSNPAPAVCCFVRNGAGELLIVQRAEDPCRGQWSLPGGYIELGENAVDTVRRELEEETGLHAMRLRLFGTLAQGASPYGAVLLLAYDVEQWHGVLRSPDPAMALDFFAKERRPPLCFDLHRQFVAEFEAQAGTTSRLAQ